MLYRLMLALLMTFTLAQIPAPAHALSETEEVVDKAATAAEAMFSDPNYPLLLDLTTKAKAVMIVPNMIKVGFIFGGRGGNAVLLARTPDGGWTSPAFYTLGGLSWGLQIGAQSSQLILVIMTEKGLNAVMERKLSLGADANLALGELGAGAQASTGMDLKADMYAFAKSSGAFAGVALDGTVIEQRDTMNADFYGAGTTPRAILIDGTATSPRAQGLINIMPR